MQHDEQGQEPEGEQVPLRCPRCGKTFKVTLARAWLSPLCPPCAQFMLDHA